MLRLSTIGDDVIAVADSGRRGLGRSRWAAIGAAVAVTLGGGGMVAVNAASSPPSSVVTIDPSRILDTRTDVGLAGPFVSAVSQKLQVTGPVATATGPRTVVPSGATGVLLNVTVVVPAAAGFVSICPGDSTGTPSTSSLNFGAGAVVPNAVQVGLPATGAHAGQIEITYDAYGNAGPATDMLIDVVGYTVVGLGGQAAWDTIPSGQTVTGFEVWEFPATGAYRQSVALPARAPVALTETNVNFSASSGSAPKISDGDASCTGSPAVPTAPPGKVCIYRRVDANATSLFGHQNLELADQGFTVGWSSTGSAVLLYVSWAYTAP